MNNCEKIHRTAYLLNCLKRNKNTPSVRVQKGAESVFLLDCADPIHQALNRNEQILRLQRRRVANVFVHVKSLVRLLRLIGNLDSFPQVLTKASRQISRGSSSKDRIDKSFLVEIPISKRANPSIAEREGNNWQWFS